MNDFIMSFVKGFHDAYKDEAFETDDNYIEFVKKWDGAVYQFTGFHLDPTNKFIGQGLAHSAFFHADNFLKTVENYGLNK